MGGLQSNHFKVLVCVKQGCVMASVIFNLFLVAVTLVFCNGLSDTDGMHVRINFRLDDSIFNLRRLQAESKTSSDVIFGLKYADDAALASHTATSL